MRVSRITIGVLSLVLAGSFSARASYYDEAPEPAAEHSTQPAACDSCIAAYCDSCSNGCGCCDNCGCQDRLLGALPSDHAFDTFVSPLSNPFFFEDPRSLTEVRGIYIYNKLPASVGRSGAQVFAAQVRGRLTERLSFIAPRLGQMDILQDHAAGFMSAPVGLKYNLIRDVDNQFLLTAGSTYFIPGSRTVYQGYGVGDFHFFLTGGKQILGNGHWISGSGFRIPADHNWGNQMWYWSNQWDYRLPGNLYPLLGTNWYHFMRSPINSGGGAPDFSGLDLVNLPFGHVAGTDVVTGVVGGKWKPSGNFEFGAGYEFPMTQRRDILGDRIYADVIFRY